MFSDLIHEQMADLVIGGSRPSTGMSGNTRSSVFFTDLHGNVDMDSEEYNNALFRDTPSQTSTHNQSTVRTKSSPKAKSRKKDGHRHGHGHGKMNMPMEDLLELAKMFTLEPKDRLAGGIANYSKVETGKYFGVEAKVQFGKHTKKLYKQRNITQSNQRDRLPVEVLEVMELCSPDKDSALRKAVNDLPFSPERPPLPYKLNTKVVIRTQSLAAESTYSEMKLVQKPVELQNYDHLLQEELEKERQAKEMTQQIMQASNAVAAMLMSPTRTPRLEPLSVPDSPLTAPDSARKKPKPSGNNNNNNNSASKPPKQLPPLQAAIMKNFENQHHSHPSSTESDTTESVPGSATPPVQGQTHSTPQKKQQQSTKKTTDVASSSKSSSHTSTPRDPAASAAQHPPSGDTTGVPSPPANGSPFQSTVHAKRQSLRRMSSIFGGLTMTAPKNEQAEVSLADLGELYKIHKHGANTDDSDPNGTSSPKKPEKRASVLLANEAEKSNYSGKKALTKMPANSPVLEFVCVDYRDPNNKKIVDRLSKSNSLFQYVEKKTLQRDFYDENDSDNSDVEDEIRLLRQHREKILATNPTRVATAAVTKEKQAQWRKKQLKATGVAPPDLPPKVRVNRMKLQSQQRQALRATGQLVSLTSRLQATPPTALPLPSSQQQVKTTANISETGGAGASLLTMRNTGQDETFEYDDDGNVIEKPFDEVESYEDALSVIRMWNDGDETDGGALPAKLHGKGAVNIDDFPLSPRSMFIDNCLRANINPRATLVLRKIYTKELNLKHLGMGNDVACLLADAIVHIPYIESLNVCDNNLTDPGLSAIVNAIVHMRQLTVLDMSFNEIGPDAAKSLNNYLSNPDCPLSRLILEKADVDDDECRDFVQALHHNVNLKELTLNDNKVGSSENLNTVMPDIVTGGEAIAELLRSENCPLQTLRLGWNMIRLGGAAELCQSLSMNQSLTFLELSYNALGVSGGIALGDALQDNKVLKHLLVANNALDSVATMVICAGILENVNLEYVCFDENPIGQQGAMVLMLLPTMVGSRVVVSARNCNLNIRDANNWFDTTAIVRTYDLDLTNPFERSIGIVISYLVPSHQTYILAHGEYYDPEKREWIDLQLKELVDKESYKLKPMDPEQMNFIELLVNVREATRDIQKAIALFEEVDADGSGQLDEEEFGGLLKKMGMDSNRDKVLEIMAEYDVDGGGVIEMTEFLLFLKSQQKKASKRLKELTEISVLASMLDNPLYQAPTGLSPPPSANKLLQHRSAVLGGGDTGSNNPAANSRASPLAMALLKNKAVENPVKRFLPPRTGRLRMTVVDGFTQKETFRVISPGDRTNILKIAEQSGEMVQMTTFGMKNYRVRLSEALSIVYRLLKENSNKVKVLATVLPQMATPADAKALVFEVLGYNLVEVARLKREIGQAYRVIMGQPDGFFNLDLSNEMDRFCLNRLLEISMTTAHFRSNKRNFFGYGRLGDTSQHGNFTCFRNELFNKKSVIINTDFASPLPKHGKLEFDFCAQKRYKADNFALSDVRFTNLLVKTFQLDASERLKALEALNRTRIACDKTLKGDGRTIYETPKDRALEIGQHCATFMEKLSERTEQIERFRQRESVKVTWEYDPTQLQLRLSTFHNVYKIPSLFKKPAPNSLKTGVSGLEVSKSSKSTAIAISSAMMLRKSALSSKRLSTAEVGDTDNSAYGPAKSARRSNSVRAPGLTFEVDSMNSSNTNTSSLIDITTTSSIENNTSSNDSAAIVDVPKSVLKRGMSSKSSIAPSSAGSVGFNEDDAYQSVADNDDETIDEAEAESERLMEMINANVRAKQEAQNTKPVLVRASTVRRLNEVIQPKKKKKKVINDDGFEEDEYVDGDEDESDSGDDSDDTEAREEKRLKEEEKRLRQEKPLSELWNRYVCLMGSSNVPIAAKAVRTLELLVEAFEAQFFYARHLEMLLILFEDLGTLKQTEDFGTYRVELIVQLFGCVIDLHNFELIMRRLTPFEAACVICRLGYLNIFNPLKPEGSYELDLTQRDQRTVMKILAQLACVEPGDNLPFIQFRWERFMDPMPGFELTENWMTEDGMPKKGVIDCTYYAGEGKCKNGCKPHVKFRKALLQLVLIEEEEIISEVDRDNEKEVTLVGISYIQSSNTSTWLNYLAYNEAYAKPDKDKKGGGDNNKKKK